MNAVGVKRIGKGNLGRVTGSKYEYTRIKDVEIMISYMQV